MPQPTTYKELLAEKARLDAQIADAQKTEAKAALQTIHTLIADFGFTAQEVFPWKPAKPKVAAKYLEPVSGATWSGRGKPPKWIAGKDRAQFAI